MFLLGESEVKSLLVIPLLCCAASLLPPVGPENSRTLIALQLRC